MQSAILQRDRQGEEAHPDRAGEEAFRRKIVDLRDGLRNVLSSRGIALSQGASNAELLSSVAQLLGKPPIKYSERLDTSWKEEYNSVVQRIRSLVEEGQFTADTKPTEIIQMIQSRCVPDGRERQVILTLRDRIRENSHQTIHAICQNC